MIDPVLAQVRRRIENDGISLIDAATEIGIGVPSLTRHLAGEYVRSDSLAKYRIWLAGNKMEKKSPALSALKEEPLPVTATVLTPDLPALLATSLLPTRRRYVVDLFCGCGGMSLGFERFKKGAVFQTALALDIEEPMVRVFNDNHPARGGELPTARQVDITDFMNEAEIQAFYLDHLARSTSDHDLLKELQKLGNFSVIGLRKTLHNLDTKFLEQLAEIRHDPLYITSLRELGSASLGQTSIIGFHNATKLPITGGGFPKLGPLIWYQDGSVEETTHLAPIHAEEKLIQACRRRMKKLWNREAEKLATRSTGSGQGQLISAADRIGKFLAFLETKPMQRVRELWIDWRATREAIRIAFLDDESVQTRLQKIYENGHQVSVLLGGPPCQGFSRIGRGKIRSLREQSVHVHEDESSVDSRNQLMHQYVLFVAALAPDVFLFENVRHFQAVVKSDGIEFDAADILAESIKSVSTSGLGYAIARKIVVASQHAVPQARERFVMAGIREDRTSTFTGIDIATWCLSLKNREPVPLKNALEGLPEPSYANQSDVIAHLPIESSQIRSEQSQTAVDLFRSWVVCSKAVDAHIARPHRQDDRGFFALMGPGKRWMDYRCDEAPTLKRLSSLLTTLVQAMNESPELAERVGIHNEEVNQLAAICNGSLSLRLLLEKIPAQPGEVQHHLLTDTYLKKRDGAHGDWLSRMDPAQPSKTIVSHMAKDTYAFVHPFIPRTLSVREAARVQSFPDDYRFGSVGLVDGFRVVGNAVPPLLSLQFAERVAQILATVDRTHAITDLEEPKQLAHYS